MLLHWGNKKDDWLTTVVMLNLNRGNIPTDCMGRIRAGIVAEKEEIGCTFAEGQL